MVMRGRARAADCLGRPVDYSIDAAPAGGAGQVEYPPCKGDELFYRVRTCSAGGEHWPGKLRGARAAFWIRRGCRHWTNLGDCRSVCVVRDRIHCRIKKGRRVHAGGEYSAVDKGRAVAHG